MQVGSLIERPTKINGENYVRMLNFFKQKRKSTDLTRKMKPPKLTETFLVDNRLLSLLEFIVQLNKASFSFSEVVAFAACQVAFAMLNRNTMLVTSKLHQH